MRQSKAVGPLRLAHENEGQLVDETKKENVMPKLTVENVGTFDVPAGKPLVLALEEEAKVDQLHACGGNAHCTTCPRRVRGGRARRR